MSAQQQEKLPPIHYHITDLGTLGGPVSETSAISNDGLIAGEASLANGTQHAVLLYKNLKLDLGTLGGKQECGTEQRRLFYPIFRTVVGASEVSAQDKDGENFCGFGSGLKCLPFLWEGGVMEALPLLGGKNGQAIAINDRGQAAGWRKTPRWSKTAPLLTRTILRPLFGARAGKFRNSVRYRATRSELVSGLTRRARWSARPVRVATRSSSDRRWTACRALGKWVGHRSGQPGRDLHHPLH